LKSITVVHAPTLGAVTVKTPDGAGTNRKSADRAGPDGSHPVKKAQMPDRARVMEFVAMVVSGRPRRAIANFYHEDATMQENRNAPRRGRDILMAHEERVLGRIKRMHTHPAEVILGRRRQCGDPVDLRPDQS